jgi:hypothetical protein
MTTKLDLSWAEHLITQYEYEHDCRLKSYEIDPTLRKLMYEKDFKCNENELELIVEELIDNI